MTTPVLKNSNDTFRNFAKAWGEYRKEEKYKLESYKKTNSELQSSVTKVVESIKEASEREKRATELLSLFGDNVSEKVCRDARVALKFAESVGGIESLKHLVENSRALQTKRRFAKKASTNKLYRDNLKQKGLVPSAVYAVKWNNLKAHFHGTSLPHATSFVFVLPDCQLPEEESSADPSVVHIRLALTAMSEVNESYINIDPSCMQLVDKSNAEALCESAFSQDNIEVLYNADGPGPEGLSVNDYAKNLVLDSCRLLRTHVHDVYHILLKYEELHGGHVRRKRGRDADDGN